MNPGCRVLRHPGSAEQGSQFWQLYMWFTQGALGQMKNGRLSPHPRDAHSSGLECFQKLPTHCSHVQLDLGTTGGRGSEIGKLLLLTSPY